MLYPATLACENSERSLGINCHGTIRPGFLWSAAVSGHFLVGLCESAFNLIGHWAGLGTGWRSPWSQTTWKDLNGLEWRWITLRVFYLRPRKAKSTKPSLSLLKATTFLESWMYFKFNILFLLPYSGKANVFLFFFSGVVPRGAPANWHSSLEVPCWYFSFMQCTEIAVY